MRQRVASSRGSAARAGVRVLQGRLPDEYLHANSSDARVQVVDDSHVRATTSMSASSSLYFKF